LFHGFTDLVKGIDARTMSTPVISVEHLSKRYLVGHRTAPTLDEQYPNFRDMLERSLRNSVRKAADVARGRQIVQGDSVEEFWALKDVGFEVEEGEVLGIIGRNGAGKSTLLKILSRITEPTAGRVTVRGRVASLLEIGTGFHPELTGRENIYLNGAVLGMSRAEIRKKFDEIVAFAEVEKFLDTPVKRYSSGMYVRLAFAVAAHLEPEILIVDEVLAVGDAEFQKKCLGKMNEVSRGEGRTVLFVSHNMGAVTRLCPTAIWLNNGRIRESGPARAVIAKYLARRRSDWQPVVALADLARQPWLKDDRLRLNSIKWLCELPLRHGEPVKAHIGFTTRAPVAAVTVGIGFSYLEGARLLSYEADFQDGYRPDIPIPGDYTVEVAITALPLGADIYSLDLACRSGGSHLLDFLPGCSQIEVISGPKTQGFIVGKGAGVWLSSNWSWEWARAVPELQLVRAAG
jgi:lipopolysaccharide transport system ATP-binding protein